MTHKYKAGNYLILQLDPTGGQIRITRSPHKGQIGSKEEAERMVQEGECASAVVMLSCWNSLDYEMEKWTNPNWRNNEQGI